MKKRARRAAKSSRKFSHKSSKHNRHSLRHHKASSKHVKQSNIAKWFKKEIQQGRAFSGLLSKRSSKKKINHASAKFEKKLQSKIKRQEMRYERRAEQEARIESKKLQRKISRQEMRYERKAEKEEAREEAKEAEKIKRLELKKDAKLAREEIKEAKIEAKKAEKLAEKERRREKAREKAESIKEEKEKSRKKEKLIKAKETGKTIAKEKLTLKTNLPEIIFLKTGMGGFDSLTKKGIPISTSNLVEGGPGSGKTIFCLTLAYNLCKQGKRVLYMSFEEPEFRLRRHMKAFGWDPEKYEKENLLMIKRFDALDIARSVEALLSEAKKELLIDVQPVLIPQEFKPDVVLIDSLSSISSAFSGEESRFRIYMEQLFRYLETHKITSFLVRETSNPSHVGNVFVERGEAVSFLSDGIIVIYSVFYKTGKRGRAVEIIKMRGTDIKRMIVGADITPKQGFIVSNKVLKGKYTLT